MKMLNRRNALKTGLLSAVAAGSAVTAGSAAAAEAGEKKYVFDLVVIGAGCAGITAALEAADLGAKVALLEKMPMPFGNTIYAGGHFNATNTFVQKENGFTDTIDEFYKDMMAVSQGRGDPELTRVYCEKSADCIEWLTKRYNENIDAPVYWTEACYDREAEGAKEAIQWLENVSLEGLV